MNKRRVLTTFIVLALAGIAASAALAATLGALGLWWLGLALGLLLVFSIVVGSIGCFSPNSPIFGAVLNGRRIDQPVIALTFDDGPSEDTTPRILDTLRARGARATFFVLGKHATQHPELVARIVREGHELANHGWTHEILMFSRPSTIRRELEDTAGLLAAQDLPRPRFYRAPHGFRNPLTSTIVSRLGYQVVGWSAGVFDTALPGVDVIVQRSVRALRPGAILLLHDADGNGHVDRAQTADALPAILDAIDARGLRTVTVAELAKLAPPRHPPWRPLASLAGIAAALVLITTRTDLTHWGDALRVFTDVNPFLVAAAILANLASIGLKASVWKAALACVPNAARIRYRDVVAATLVGFLLNSILPGRLGEPGRALSLQRSLPRESGRPMSLSAIAGTLIAEGLVLGLTLALLLFVATLTVPDMPPEFRAGAAGLIAIVLIALAGVGVLHVAGRVRTHAVTATPKAGHGRRQRLIGRLNRVVRELSHGQTLFTSPSRLAVALGAGVGSWVANLIAIYCTVLAFGVHPYAFAAAVAVFAVSNLVGIFQLTPGNVGVFQVSIALMLAHSFAIDGSVGLAFGVGLQLIEAGIGAGLGLLVLTAQGLSLRPARSARGPAYLNDAAD